MPKTLVLSGPRTLTFEEYALPPLGPRDVLLQAVLSGISHGTEMNLYRGTAPFAVKHFDGEHRVFVANDEPGFQPTGLGYELVSRVVAVGRDAHSVRVGDLVHTATRHQPLTRINLDEDASAEIPMQVLPAGLTAEQAVFGALVGVALAGVHDAQIKVGDDVVVYGLGTIGLLVVQLARLNGALHITAVDPIARRRELALTLGADVAFDPTTQDPGAWLKQRDHAPRGADVVLEVSGHYAALAGAIRCAHMGGTVVTMGYYQGSAAPLQLGEEWHHNRLNLVSSMAVWGCPSRFHPMWNRPRVTRTAFDLLARGLVCVDGFITHRYAYSDAPAAYRMIDEQGAETIKVVLDYGQES